MDLNKLTESEIDGDEKNVSEYDQKVKQSQTADQPEEIQSIQKTRIRLK